MTVLQVKKDQDAKGKTPMVKLKDILSFTKQEGSIVQIKSTVSQTVKKVPKESVYVNSAVEKAVMMKAQRIESGLPRNYPTMIKVMLPSHVTGGFWLGLVKGFCTKHLPEEDTMMDLEDENGEVQSAKYLVHKQGLSGGWRAFSISHQLVKGDVIVFQLVKPTRFKVHIARVSGSDGNVDVGLPQTANIKDEVDANGDSISTLDSSSDTDTSEEGGIVPRKSTIRSVRFTFYTSSCCHYKHLK
ncbi:B3 domain-containing protein At3g19184 [Linum grandiflorum]